MGIACPETGQIAVFLQNIVHSLCVAGMPVIFFNKMSVSQNIISVFSAYFASVEKSDRGFWMWNDNYPAPFYSVDFICQVNDRILFRGSFQLFDIIADANNVDILSGREFNRLE